jgi:FAD/FMN-containing dehydrogenase
MTTDLSARLQAIVGADHVRTDDESRERASFDAIDPMRLMANATATESRVDVVVRPANTAEVAAVVVLANELGLAVIPYGGGTGVMGAVMPLEGGIALDLRRMNRVLNIQREDRLAVVQPGVVLADLGAAAAEVGLQFTHDPWSVPIATVGGAISTDSVGYRAGKYGSMGEQVVAYEAVLGDGAIVRTKPLVRQSSGPMLARLLSGAEGTLAVITEATVRLFAEPEVRAFATVGFASFEAGFPVVARLFAMGLVPALVDLTEEDPGDDAQGFRCLLYLGFEGFREQVEAERSRALAEALADGGVDLGPEATQHYWDDRHAVAERWRDRTEPLRPTERWAGRWTARGWRPADYLHIALPVTRVLEYKRFADEVVARHGFEIRETSIWTDPRLFSIYFAGPDDPEAEREGADGEAADGRGADGEIPPLWAAVDELLSGAIAMGGGVEYCHGLGTKLQAWAVEEWGDALPLARRLKQALDPNGTLNPKKLGLA